MDTSATLRFDRLTDRSAEKFVSDFTAGMDKASELAREVDRRLAVIDAMLTTIENRQTDNNASLNEKEQETAQ